MKRFILSMSVFFGAMNTVFADQHEGGFGGGNGTDPWRVVIENAKVTLKANIVKLQRCFELSELVRGTNFIVQQNLPALFREIDITNMEFVRDLNQNTCLQTKPVSAATITINIDRCNQSLLADPILMVAVLAHEYSHHLGITNENTADFFGRILSEDNGVMGCYSRGPNDRFLVLVQSPSTGNVGKSFGYGTLEQGIAVAHSYCKSPDCRVVQWHRYDHTIFTRFCMGVASHLIRDTFYGWLNGESSSAKNMALSQCNLSEGGGCRIVDYVCTDGGI